MAEPRENAIVLDKLPMGWKYIKNATTAPRWYRWACNGESHFSGKRTQALIKNGEGNKDVHKR